MLFSGRPIPFHIPAAAVPAPLARIRREYYGQIRARSVCYMLPPLRRTPGSRPECCRWMYTGAVPPHGRFPFFLLQRRSAPVCGKALPPAAPLMLPSACTLFHKKGAEYIRDCYAPRRSPALFDSGRPAAVRTARAAFPVP